MLTGTETVAATFTSTAHRHRDGLALVDLAAGGERRSTTWASLAWRVRHAALALTEDGPVDGEELALALDAPLADRATCVLVAAAVGARAVVGPGTGAAPPPFDELAVTGAAIDERHPDRFEHLLAQRSTHDPLLEAGGVVHTSSSLLVAARSLAQALAVTAEHRVLVWLPTGTAGEVVAAVLVPGLTGASAWSMPPGALVEDVWTDEPDAPPVVALVPAADAGRLVPPVRGPVRRRRGRPRGATVVVDDLAASSPVPSDPSAERVLSVDAAGGVVTGFGPRGTLGRPLPGVSVAIDDDGEVLLRSGSVPPGAPGLRDDGWLAIGHRGHLSGGALVLDVAAAVAAGPP